MDISEEPPENTHQLVTLYMTADSQDVAMHIATSLAREDLIACANIIPGMRSVYKWEGTIQLDNELLVFMKTTSDKVDDAVARIKQIHTYDIPCVTVLPVLGGNQDYMKWVSEQTHSDVVK